ncbi:hypothetical protein Dimus_028516 [Dionaea muscipula]
MSNPGLQKRGISHRQLIQVLNNSRVFIYLLRHQSNSVLQDDIYRISPIHSTDPIKARKTISFPFTTRDQLNILLINIPLLPTNGFLDNEFPDTLQPSFT